MNQKDYKEIAGILKRRRKRLIFYSIVKIIPLREFDLMVINLADYFEREQKNNCVYCNNGLINKDNVCVTCKGQDARSSQFNRKQFLKDCGVK